MSDLIGIHYPQRWEEVKALLDRVEAEKLFALVSGVGVLILGDKDRALRSFRNCLRCYSEEFGLDDVSLLSVADPSGRDAIGYAVNERECHYLYGVPLNDVLTYFADLAGSMQ